MAEQIFPVLPERRRAKAVQAAVYAVFGAAGVLYSGALGGLGWVLAGLFLGMAGGKLISLLRMKNAARVDDAGVTVWLPTGREMKAGWDEIEAHTIDPARRIGGIVLRAGNAGRVSLLPVATRDIGPEAAEALIAAMKERVPTLEYRVPRLGMGRSKDG